MTTRFTILGCGSSGGVPRLGQGWGTCDPAEPKNRRRRCSLLVERISPQGTTAVLVDTSPDVREQLLQAHVARLDAVLYTHDHADHLHGIDDLRGLVLADRRRIDIYADAPTTAMLMQRFGYCFAAPDGSEYPPILNAYLMKPGEPVSIAGAGGVVEALPVLVRHGATMALGFRFGGVMYTPDINAVPAESDSFFRDLDVWIIDALRHRQHPSHFSLTDALTAIETYKPRRAILTNLHNDMDFNDLVEKSPLNVEPAHDGLSFAMNIP